MAPPSFTPEPYDAATAATWLVCNTCGTQFPTHDASALTTCRICDDPRQFVPAAGQSFTPLGELAARHRNTFEPCAADPRLTFIATAPKLGIGQRAVFIEAGGGRNVLWDCVTLLDDETIAWVKARGGLEAIVISHPHFYSAHVQWARAFACPVYLSAEDRGWAALASAHQVPLAETHTEVVPGLGVTAVKLGGHFPGSLVLLFGGRLLVADTLMTTAAGVGDWSVDAAGVARERPAGVNSFAFLYSIPNFVPLSLEVMMGMWAVLRRYEFRATYGGFAGMDIEDVRVKARVLESMQIQARHMGHGEHEFMKLTVDDAE